MQINLRSLFIPVQPTVKQTSDDVSYYEYHPDPILRNYIHCYWKLSTRNSLQKEITYRVVADGCIDIFFDLDMPKDNYVMGFCKKYTEFQLENSSNYIGVRFLPTMFPRIFNVNAGELTDRTEHLDCLVPKTASFIARHFHSGLQTQQVNQLLDDHFIQLLKGSVIEPDARLYNAMDIILMNHGVLYLEKDLDIGLSSRQLRRLFNFYIGDTAKTFSKVVRFQHILRANPSKQGLHENKLFYSAGYYDQAHFIKEFKNLYGITPGKAFGK